MANEKSTSSLNELKNVWDYVAYGVAAAAAALYEFHAGSHNYMTTVNAAGMAAVPARRAAVSGIEKLLTPGKTKEKLADAKVFFASDPLVNAKDLVAEAEGFEQAWSKKLLSTAKLETEVEGLVTKYLTRRSAKAAQLLIEPPKDQPPVVAKAAHDNGVPVSRDQPSVVQDSRQSLN